MKKQFLFNIILLICLNALVKPFWVFGIDRTVQNIVGAEAYGLYFALFNFSILFNTVLDFGLTNFNNRSIAQNPALLNTYFPRLISIKIILGIAYLTICLAAAFVLGYSATAVKLVFLLAFNQFLASMLLFLRSNISGLQYFITDSIVSVLDRLLMIIFCGLILWTKLFPVEINVYSFVLLQSLAYFLACVIAFVLILSKGLTPAFKNIPLFSTALFRSSFPYALLGLLMVLYNRIDAVLLERLLPNGAQVAGIYAQSFRIFDAVTMIPVLFASLLLPMFANLLARNINMQPLIRTSFSILFTGMVILVINFIVFAEPLVVLLYREYYHETVLVFVLLMLNVIPVSLTYIFGTLLTADGKLSILNRIAAGALLVNVTSNLVLIPRIGVTGAAVTALICQLFVAGVQLVVCKKRYRLRVDLTSFSIYVLFVAISVGLTLLFFNFSFGLLQKIALSSILSVVAAFLLRIINLKEIVSVIGSDNQKLM